MVLQDEYVYNDKVCKKCYELYANVITKWCRLCQTSGNKQIDDFIQEKQLNDPYFDIVFEWIPYSQFNEINETGKNGPMTVYSAIWKNGPLYYQYGRYKRDPNKEIALRCLHNSQDQVESLLNEVYIALL